DCEHLSRLGRRPSPEQIRIHRELPNKKGSAYLVSSALVGVAPTVLAATVDCDDPIASGIYCQIARVPSETTAFPHRTNTLFCVQYLTNLIANYWRVLSHRTSLGYALVGG